MAIRRFAPVHRWAELRALLVRWATDVFAGGNRWVSNLPVERITFTSPTSFRRSERDRLVCRRSVGHQSSFDPEPRPPLRQRHDHKFHSCCSSRRISPCAHQRWQDATEGRHRTILRPRSTHGSQFSRSSQSDGHRSRPEWAATSLCLIKIRSTAGYETRAARHGIWNSTVRFSRDSRLRVAYEQRNTSNDFVVSPIPQGTTGILELSNRGFDSYREFQVAARYKAGQHMLNASYVRSRAFGDLNDFNQFFGNLAQPVIQPDARGRFPFDAPNRFLFWGTIAAPWKLTRCPGLRPTHRISVFGGKRVRRIRWTTKRRSFPALFFLRPPGFTPDFADLRRNACTLEWARGSSISSITLIRETCRTTLRA